MLTVASLAAAACGGGAGGSGGGSGSHTVTVAVVANPDITQMEQLIGTFEKEDPGITVKFDTLPENQERSEIQKDISTSGGLYDVVMISNYETPIWAKNGWLDDLSSKFIASDASYDAGDLLPPIAKSLSYQGDLYSVPFYGESSMLYYRTSMLKAAGITMPEHPTWAQVAAAAAKLNQPGKVAGICLRGENGWGENLATLDTVINTYGGSWYNTAWQPQLTSPATAAAVNFYVNMVRKDGESGAASDGFTELLTLYEQSKCAMWYDSTVAASSLSAVPSVFNDTSYAFAPVDKTSASGWLYTWSLGIPKDSANQTDAWKFVSWATSKGYLNLVGQKLGWAQVPPGSRTSTYQNPNYQKAASAFASITLNSINSVDQATAIVPKVPYVGIQFVDIPQFEDLGTSVSNQISGAIAGSESVSQALTASQADAVPVGQQQK
ncbi:MAG: sugar ABC transporter substrate-binding protein [Streptosporangiaceae bacterium]